MAVPDSTAEDRILVFTHWCLQCRRELSDVELWNHYDTHPDHYFEEFYRWQIGIFDPTDIYENNSYAITEGTYPGLEHIFPLSDETSVMVFVQGGGGDIHIPFGDYNQDYFKTSSTSWDAAGRFVFRGKNVIGIPSSIRFIVKQENDCAHTYVRVWDLTNNKKISEIRCDSDNWIIVHDYDLENIPNEQAIWEVHVRTNNCNKDAYLSSVVICFGGNDHTGYTGGTGHGCGGGST